MNSILEWLSKIFGSKATVPPAATPKPPLPPSMKPPPPVTPVSKLTSDAWMNWAHHEATDGIEEEPNKDNRGPVIRRYIQLAHVGQEGDPYCAVFVNAALEQAGIRGTRSAAARSFEINPNFVKLTGPARGAITTFWRGSRNGGLGHVGFYVGETENHVYTLGANQHDDCNESPFPKDGKSFGLVGYYWPRGVALPKVGKIALNGRGVPIAPVKVV